VASMDSEGKKEARSKQNRTSHSHLLLTSAVAEWCGSLGGSQSPCYVTGGVRTRQGSRGLSGWGEDVGGQGNL
jgi:hypothetical protein